MKSIITLLLICIFNTSFSLTNITNPSVFGNWTLAGSPYIVQVNINVPNIQTLKIDAGVEVQFYAGTKFNILGKLIAQGTSAQPIIFKAIDTTDWSNPSVTTGGWNGLHFMQYQGGGIDSSKLEYVTIQDCKYGYNGVVNEVNPFLTYRKLKLSHCTFTHNTCGAGMYTSGMVLLLNGQNATDTIEMEYCNINNNNSVFSIVRIMGSYSYIHHNHIHHNQQSSPIWGSWFNALIESNEIDNNEMINDAAPIKLSVGTASIRSNIIHHNKCHQMAAIGCRSGKIDIDNNLICNNEQLDANCGATGGGGGIHLAHNEGGADFANTYYRVRNNVIANNSSAYGGGGIYVYHAKADIMNNTIVNNKTANGMGNAILILDSASEVKIKNNLFKGNSNLGWADSTAVVYIFSCSKLMYDYNYSPGTFSQAITGYYTQLLGDTIHNVIGNNPMLVAPTANNLVTTDATNANFNINNMSPCVDKGDTVGASPLPLDYAGSNRIMGAKIDIGAFEIIKSAEGINDILSTQTLFSIYPNPAQNFIQINSSYQVANIQIISVDGKVLKSLDVAKPNNIISLNEYTKGIYIIRFTTNHISKTEKLIIE